jgi:hypothetical protein
MRASSRSPRARSGQWCTVRMASAAAKAPSRKGRCVADAWTTGALPPGALPDHRQRRFHRHDPMVHRFVGARARADVHHAGGLSQGPVSRRRSTNFSMLQGRPPRDRSCERAASRRRRSVDYCSQARLLRQVRCGPPTRRSLRVEAHAVRCSRGERDRPSPWASRFSTSTSLLGMFRGLFTGISKLMRYSRPHRAASCVVGEQITGEGLTLLGALPTFAAVARVAV